MGFTSFTRTYVLPGGASHRYPCRMISNTAIQDFEAACESVQFDAERATHQECMKVGGQLPSGHGRRPIMMDAAAAEVFEAHAQHLHRLLGQLNAADPATDAEARRQQLGELIDGQLRKLGHVVEGALREQVGLPMMALVRPRQRECGARCARCRTGCPATDALTPRVRHQLL